MPEGGGRRSEIRDQKSEIRSRRSEGAPVKYASLLFAQIARIREKGIEGSEAGRAGKGGEQYE